MARILVVHDEPKMVAMFTDILSDEGYEAVGCAQPLRAVAAAREARPDLILMRESLPSWDGLQSNATAGHASRPPHYSGPAVGPTVV